MASSAVGTGLLAEARKLVAAGERGKAAHTLLDFARTRYAFALSMQGAHRSAALEQSAEAARLARLLMNHTDARQPRLSIGGDTGDETTTFVPEQRPKVRFSDVAGLEDVKREIDLALIRPLKYPQVAQELGVSPGGGLLLYGPPGTGKTLIARAVAGEVDAPFFAIKPDQIMSQWVGKAEQNIAALFRQARSHPLAVIFMDEVDALVPRRSRTNSSVMARVVPQILAEMQGFEEHSSPLLFIGATNQPQALDEAMTRPGRLDTSIYVGLPDQQAREELFRLHLRKRSCSPDIGFDQLAEMTDGYSGADIAGICHHAAKRVFEEVTSAGKGPRAIETHDLLYELANTSPSVGRDTLRAFDAYRGHAR